MHPFEKHYTEDIEQIELEGVTFHVKLPTQDNKRFQRLVVSEMVNFDSDTGEYQRRELSPGEVVELQVEAFIKTCIRRVEGWKDYTVDKLLALPDACEDLWEEAARLANQRDAEATAAAKKPQTISPGPESGQGDTNSIDTLKQQTG